MRFLLTAVVILCYSVTECAAQDELKPLPNNEIGLNINGLASNFLSFEDESDNIMSLENLVFFKTGRGKIKFRSALNYGITNSIVGNSSLKNSFFLLKAGFERKKRLTKAWTFHSGLELFGFRSNSEVITIDPFFGDFKSTQTNTRLGASFIYGIQVSLSSRIALGTEGYFFFSINELESSEGSPVFPGGSNDSSLSLGISLPKSLLLSYYF